MATRPGKRIHFIAIGGAVMHNLAIDMQRRGYRVTGSDDEIFEPSGSRLAACGLLPDREGWYPGRITHDIDTVILGMHARTDNPELLRSRELGLRICSFPEYIYEQTRHKQRVVIGGSHGKTTITSMIMHVIRFCGMEFDYLVGAQLEGFDTMVSLRQHTSLAIFEGDEYLSSAIDPRPKFHLYRPHIAVLSGIAWDHMNVFPTFRKYRDQFVQFLHHTEPEAVIFYDGGDRELQIIAGKAAGKHRMVPYQAHPSRNTGNDALLVHEGGETPVRYFGKHNMLNTSAALNVSRELGIAAGDFYRAIQSFNGAARRLQLLAGNKNTAVYHDFAHAPSKLKATLGAVREKYEGYRLTACIELHTFSSLNKDFLNQYAGSMNEADDAIVFFNPATLEHKRLPPISGNEIFKAFGRDDILVFNRTDMLENYLHGRTWNNHVLLMMSSGNFSGLDIQGLAAEIAGKTGNISGGISS